MQKAKAERINNPYPLDQQKRTDKVGISVEESIRGEEGALMYIGFQIYSTR